MAPLAGRATRPPVTWLAVGLCVACLKVTRPGHADQLERVRSAGVLRVAVLPGEPPMASDDPSSHELVGYEIDIASAIARHIGVRLQTIRTPLGQRTQLLRSGGADLIVAQMTITPQRADQIDFSLPYFTTGLRLLVHSGDSDRIEDYGSSRIGADRGSTQEEYLGADFRGATIVLFDDARQALQALRDRKVSGILQDGVVLAGLLSRAPDGSDLKMLPDILTDEDIAVGIPKSENALLDVVNTTLLVLEQSGEANRLYHTWFDPIGDEFRTRRFTIGLHCGALTGWTRVECPAAAP